MVHPPILPEDTQPRALRWDDTQPNPVVLRQRWWRHRGRWILITVVLLTSLSLIATLALLFRPQQSQTVTTITNKTITLNIGDNSRTLQTAALTVGDVLADEDIQLAPDDALLPEADVPVEDNMTITIKRARDVTLTINGSPRTFKSPYDNPQDILEHAGITLSSQDRIWLDGQETQLTQLPVWASPITAIDIHKAVTILVIDDGAQITITTLADTLGNALFEAGIVLYLADELSHAPETPITDNMQITITRATPITLEVDGVTVEARTNASTVGDMLTEMDAPLFGLDYVRPPSDTPITEGMTVEIVRVTEEVTTTAETIPYESIYQADPAMNLDEKATIQAGQNGEQETHVRIRYENGVEVKRTTDEVVITQNPVDEIIAYGTNVVLHSIDTPQGTLQYWRKMRVYATSYHPEALGGDNVTAIGMTLQHGIIGADPRLIPYRTNMYVPGYGTGIMADTGGARSSRYWIDLGYSDEDYKAWHKYVDVYLLEPIPAEINYLLPTWTPLR